MDMRAHLCLSGGALLQAQRVLIDLQRLPVALETQQDQALAKVGRRKGGIPPDRLIIGIQRGLIAPQLPERHSLSGIGQRKGRNQAHRLALGIQRLDWLVQQEQHIALAQKRQRVIRVSPSRRCIDLHCLLIEIPITLQAPHLVG